MGPIISSVLSDCRRLAISCPPPPKLSSPKRYSKCFFPCLLRNSNFQLAINKATCARPASDIKRAKMVAAGKKGWDDDDDAGHNKCFFATTAVGNGANVAEVVSVRPQHEEKC